MLISVSCVYQTTDDSLAPLSINCWPSTSGAESYVNIEYEAIEGLDLQTVVIAIPLPALSHAPRVSQASLRDLSSHPAFITNPLSTLPHAPMHVPGKALCTWAVCHTWPLR